MRMHELQVEQSFCRQKHVTHLVHAIEEASPAGSSIEVHVHAASTPALSFYSALRFEWHACSNRLFESDSIAARLRAGAARLEARRAGLPVARGKHLKERPILRSGPQACCTPLHMQRIKNFEAAQEEMISIVVM